MTDVIPTPRSAFITDLTVDQLLRSSRDRLLLDDYEPAAVVRESAVSPWPGDLAGRLLLSLSRLARAGHVGEERVRALFEAMVDETADVGYFGPELGDDVEEQQIACHGWVAAAYFQYGHVFGDERGHHMGMRVVDALLLPALARFGDYPHERQTSLVGAPSGTATQTVNGWRISTDTWCVFLALNGLLPAWEHTRRDDIAAVIEVLVDKLALIDVVEQRAQLHASLTAARGAARYAELSGSESALRTAVEVYRTYTEHARTLNWATYNWFDRPDTWTEPCAIVDSLGLALALWRLTGEDHYARDVVRIEENALAFAERADGSFGLDSIATMAAPELRVVHMDARWCCTVRGCVGLMDVRDHAAYWESGGLTLALPRTGVASNGAWSVRTELSPGRSRLTLVVVTAPEGAVDLRVRSPFFDVDVVLPAQTGASAVQQLRWESWTERLPAGLLVIEQERIIVPADEGPIPLRELRTTVREGSTVRLVTPSDE